mmetsp:Transcript_17059/g.39788  ORF Transcript_17059/g.39788 Transcript_17059/m.39788 type:complete len:222 (+) Transcript_17059:92-757(+)
MTEPEGSEAMWTGMKSHRLSSRHCCTKSSVPERSRGSCSRRWASRRQYCVTECLPLQCDAKPPPKRSILSNLAASMEQMKQRERSSSKISLRCSRDSLNASIMMPLTMLDITTVLTTKKLTSKVKRPAPRCSPEDPCKMSPIPPPARSPKFSTNSRQLGMLLHSFSGKSSGKYMCPMMAYVYIIVSHRAPAEASEGMYVRRLCNVPASNACRSHMSNKWKK